LRIESTKSRKQKVGTAGKSAVVLVEVPPAYTLFGVAQG
jgi:hypothetical protein